MLAIQEGQYTFPMYIEEDDDIIDIYVGNAKRRNAPYIRISIFKPSDVVLQDLTFFPHCSISEKLLQKGDGSVSIMLKAVLKWLVTKYDFMQDIEFTDNSKFKTNNGTVYLAEKCVLIEGQTWYMKHFGAIPSSSSAKIALKSYMNLHEKYKNEIVNLDKDLWLQDNLEVLYSKFPSINGKRISGTTWKIAKNTINQYNVNPIEVQIGGGHKACSNLKKLYLENMSYDLPRTLYYV